MPVADYEKTIEGLVIRHRPFQEIEHLIDETPLDGEQKAALWLYAWSYPEVRGQQIAAARLPPAS
jgi:hypothetical protein